MGFVRQTWLLGTAVRAASTGLEETRKTTRRSMRAMLIAGISAVWSCSLSVADLAQEYQAECGSALGSPTCFDLLDHGHCACHPIFGLDSRPQIGCALAHALICHGLLNRLRQTLNC